MDFSDIQTLLERVDTIKNDLLKLSMLPAEEKKHLASACQLETGIDQIVSLGTKVIESWKLVLIQRSNSGNS